MHEMSLCESIVQVLEEQAQQQHFQRVKTLWLEIGTLAGVEIDALTFSFDVVSRNTLADGARLEIIRSPGTAWCFGCCETVTINQKYDPCPICEGHQLQINGGSDMKIKELEVV